jgi:hypothetical protein
MTRHISGTRQYARILKGWVEELGLDPADYGTHSMRRTKATLIYRRTKNLRAVQLLLGHSKLDYLLRRTDEFTRLRTRLTHRGARPCHGRGRGAAVDKPAHWQFDPKPKKTFRSNLLCRNVLVLPRLEIERTIYMGSGVPVQP